MQATARAHPNIALIKYWGKRDRERNLPAVGSISITLSELYTDMTVASGGAADGLVVNGAVNDAMLPRVSDCLTAVAGVDRALMSVTSSNNFPVAAGLASSSSAFASLVVAASAAAEQQRDVNALARLAGGASGSAARSLYGGFVELANSGDSIKVNAIRDVGSWPLRVVIAITEAGPKPVSSGEAMEVSRKTSPFYSRWVSEQNADLDVARDAIAACDFGKLAAVAEHNCLKMHSVMWASRPPAVFWNAATLDCLQTIRALQGQGIGVFFTIDAGPQVKAICVAEDEARVRDALQSTAGVVDIMTSGLGQGARLTATA